MARGTLPRLSQALEPGVRVELTFTASKAAVLPLNDPGKCFVSGGLASCKTIGPLVLMANQRELRNQAGRCMPTSGLMGQVFFGRQQPTPRTKGRRVPREVDVMS
jgi:hypothetical protein